MVTFEVCRSFEKPRFLIDLESPGNDQGGPHGPNKNSTLWKICSACAGIHNSFSSTRCKCTSRASFKLVTWFFRNKSWRSFQIGLQHKLHNCSWVSAYLLLLPMVFPDPKKIVIFRRYLFILRVLWDHDRNLKTRTKTHTLNLTTKTSMVSWPKSFSKLFREYMRLQAWSRRQ